MAAIMWTIHAICPSIIESLSASPGAGNLDASYNRYLTLMVLFQEKNLCDKTNIPYMLAGEVP
jgi:hypothetical protein